MATTIADSSYCANINFRTLLFCSALAQNQFLRTPQDGHSGNARQPNRFPCCKVRPDDSNGQIAAGDRRSWGLQRRGIKHAEMKKLCVLHFSVLSFPRTGTLARKTGLQAMAARGVTATWHRLVSTLASRRLMLVMPRLNRDDGDLTPLRAPGSRSLAGPRTRLARTAAASLRRGRRSGRGWPRTGRRGRSKPRWYTRAG